jgi:hypothetical protein
LVRAVVPAVGIVLVLGNPPALHAQPANDWIGKRVIPKSPGFLLKIENQLVDPRAFDIYRVEKADAPQL